MNCDVCGDEIIDHMPFSCKECGNTHCQDHRLPENHHCVGLRKTDGPWFQGVSKGRPRTMINIEDTETDRWNRHGGDDASLPSNRKKRDTRPTPGEGDVAGAPDDRTTRTDELEEQRKERFSSPDVNLDGSLSKANYEEDIESIAEKENDPSDPTGSGLISRILNWFSA